MELVKWELKIVSNMTNLEPVLNADKTILLSWDPAGITFSSVAGLKLKIILANSVSSLSKWLETTAKYKIAKHSTILDAQLANVDLILAQSETAKKLRKAA